MNYKKIAELFLKLNRAKTVKEVESLKDELLRIDFENRKMDITKKVLDRYRKETKGDKNENRYD